MDLLIRVAALFLVRSPITWPSSATLQTTSKGIPGIGHKRASAVLKVFSNLEEIYANFHEVETTVPAFVARRLREHRDLAFMNRELTKLHLHTLPDMTKENLKLTKPDANYSKIFRNLKLSNRVMMRIMEPFWDPPQEQFQEEGGVQAMLVKTHDREPSLNMPPPIFVKSHFTGFTRSALSL